MTVDRSAMFVAECCNCGDPQRHGLTHWIDSQRHRLQHRNSIGSICDVLICNVAEVAVAAAIAPYQNGILPPKGIPPKTSDDKGMACARKRAVQTMSRGPKRPHRQNPNVSRPQKKPRWRRIDVTHPKKGPRQRKQCHAAPKGREEIPMSRGSKKAATTKDRCRAPQKRPGQHKTMSRGPKRPRRRITNVSRPQKKTRRQRIDVACPQEGPRQNKTMSHGPKGRADKTPTSRPQKKPHDDEAGMPRSPRRRGDERRQSRNAAGCEKGSRPTLSSTWVGPLTCTRVDCYFFTSGKFPNTYVVIASERKKNFLFIFPTLRIYGRDYTNFSGLRRPKTPLPLL